MKLWELPAANAAALIRQRKLSCEEYVRAFVERISERDALIRAWAWVEPEAALREARERDREPNRSALHGIPFGVKDMINTRDQPTQHNSPIYARHRPGEDANCVAVMRASGAIVLGKTETLEFAAGGRKPLTRNPRNVEHTPGGSSSGSGAAVADSMVPLALGTQTGGSAIRPAAYCGVYGMKPTYGRLSFEGAKHYCVHLDTIGFYGRTVEDLALVSRAFRLVERAEPQRYRAEKLRIGICETPFWDLADEDAQRALHDAAQRLSDAGVEVAPVVLPKAFASMKESRDLIMHEGGRGAFIPEYLSAPHLLHEDFKAKVENRRGYTAEQMRTLLDEIAARRVDFECLFGNFDAILTLSAPGEAPLGLETQGNSLFNRMWTALHVPCINLPGHVGNNGLPIGLQLVQRRYEDERLLEVAATLAEILEPAGFRGVAD